MRVQAAGFAILQVARQYHAVILGLESQSLQDLNVGGNIRIDHDMNQLLALALKQA